MAAHPQRAVHVSVLLSLLALLWAGRSSAAFTAKYCSSFNSADTSANYSNFQSNGLCDSYCSGYSYAILQNYACWCSNYTPDSSTTVDLDECDSECPGYPDDSCGKVGEYYVYLFKNKAAAGTKGPSTSTSATQRTTTVQDTVTLTPTPDSTSTSASSSKTSSTTKTKGGSTSTSASIATITTSGQIQTVTVEPDGSIREDSESKGGLSTGAAVGVAVGVVISVIAISGVIFFFWWKRRRERQQESAEPSPRSSSAGMVSTMASMAETGGQPGRRGSKFMPIDDRMEFHHGIYARGDGSISRESVDSLQDNMDYSRRVLRATNPDPPPSNG